MSTAAAQLRFAVEFALFLVTVAGAAIVMTRPDLVGAGRRSRSVLVPGFILVAIAAFLHGSLLTDARETPVVIFRCAGIILLALGTLGWGTDRAPRRLLWLSLVLLAAAEYLTLLEEATASDWVRGAGALFMGVVLLMSARRSISARITVSVGAILLVVVLAVSVALSAVVARTVEEEAFKRIDARASAEVQEITGSALDDAVTSAKLAALTIQGSRAPQVLALFGNPDLEVEHDIIQTDLTNLRELMATSGPLLYATGTGRVVVGIGFETDEAADVIGSDTVSLVLNPPEGQEPAVSAKSVELVAGKGALAMGVYRVVVGGVVVGAVVATEALDSDYLLARSRNEPELTLAVADRDRLLALVGQEVPAGAAVQLAREAFGESGRAKAQVAGSFLVARVVTADGAFNSPQRIVVIASRPSAIVDDTRTDLFKTLFLVALAAALTAFVIAVIVGERIGTGIRRLTLAAQEIQAGDLTVRAAMSSRDEVGVLGTTFDSMAGSIETLASELRQSAEDEAQIRNRLEAVVGGMGEALLAVDGDGRIATFNGAAEDLFGVPARQALGAHVGDVATITAEDGTNLMPRLATPPEAGWNESAVVVRPDGLLVPVALSAGGLRGSGNEVVGGVYVLRDMRREREAERAKSELLSNISHELRTPLVPIKGYAELLLRRDVPPDKARESLEEIVEAADRLETVVQRLLDVAAQEAAPTDMRRDRVQVGPMLEAVVDRWKTRVDDRHPITTRIARSLPDLLGDRALLERCLDELVDNAIKFSPDGGPVNVTARLSDNGTFGGTDRADGGADGGADEGTDGDPAGGHGPAVDISVRDHGIGIPADRLEGIFEDFAQGDSSPTRMFGGLGLGLALVRRIVEAHQGELVCKTVPGKGSRFSMVLPIAPSRSRHRRRP
ncbi:MAG: two-component system, OmpR family, sensor histidine kinase VicK [Actinomycetota bacterium]|jgi:PAS domain S-box-containing protein|nr:two-component system, OmpR family, sensor histidine kinase VicK [Actinomycetota bacterium]